jgi:membrane-associated protein
MGEIFQQALSLTNSFNLWLIFTIFAISLVAEFGFSIPYLLETIWLVTGYNVIDGNITPVYIVIFCIITLIGRELGAGALYQVSRYGRTPLERLYQKLAQDLDKTPTRKPAKRYLVSPLMKLGYRFFALNQPHKARGSSQPEKAKVGTFCHSTLNIVLGRFVWLKIPITITMSITKHPIRLLIGVGLFSLVWDGIYITIGVFGAGSQVNPLTIIIGTLSAMIILNTALYFARRARVSRYTGAG